MGRSWWGKFLFLVFVTVLSVVYIYPTVARINPETSKFPFKQKINLGLDLQGGLYLVLGVDFNKVYQDIINRQATSVVATLKDENIQFQKVHALENGPVDDPRLIVTMDPAQHDAVLAQLRKNSSLRLTGDDPGKLEFGLSHTYRDEVRDHTLNQSQEVIRNRIDEFGVTEPSITTQGTDRIVVELPGVKDIERAKGLIGETARLEFHIVNDKAMNPGQVAALVQDVITKNHLKYREGIDRFSDYVTKINELAKGKIPDDSVISFEIIKHPGTNTETRVPYLLYKKAEVTGNDLQDAQVAFDPETHRPNVAFTLNPRGADLFGKLTEANIGNRLAIVLDNIVHSAPVIQSRIGARGQITLGQGDQNHLMQEAKDLAIVLRAGALPAKLDFLEQRVVGPSLGEDSIKNGALAAIIGSLAVFLFVSIYYRVSGVIAVLSLILNVLYVLACLVGLEATLTLPGIAGIALTVGIAVDSNVVIYERIREELNLGKRPGAAVDSGFQKALRTILDANVTNAAAAIVLLIYGTGPIKGFAVTLLIGIVTTLFTAVFVCRVIFDLYVRYLEDRGKRALSI